MGWYFSGEDLVVEERYDTRLMTDLYLDGTNNVPKILLGEEVYGVRSGRNKLYIKRDRYYDIAMRMRNLIKSDFGYRLFLKKKTKELLRRFSEETDELERQVASGHVNADWLKESLDFYGAMLCLLEFNGMISFTWFEQQFVKLTDEEELFIKDFSYTRDYSHRVYLYMNKLQLLDKLYDSECFENEKAVDEFMDSFNYLSDKGDPLCWDFAEKKEELCEELRELRSVMSRDRIRDELEQIKIKRTTGWDKYNEKLCLLNELCIKKGMSGPETANLLHAVTMISFTFTEEEQRHFCQDRYWVLLNKLIRQLELPHNFVSAEWLVDAVRQS